MKKILFLLTGFVFMLQACGVQNLPDERPKDMIINYTVEDARQENGRFIYLSQDSNYVTFKNYGTENKVYLKFNNSDLDNIYKVFKDNNFSNIGVTTDDIAKNRGGSTLSISFDGETITKSNTGTSFVENSSEKLYVSITDAIDKLVDDFLELLKRNFKIDIDKILYGEHRNFKLEVNGDYTYDSEKQGPRDSIIVSLLDGPNVFNISVIDKIPKSGKKLPIANKRIVINVDPTVTGARFYHDGMGVYADVNKIDLK
jgi:hypothetical protein